MLNRANRPTPWYCALMGFGPRSAQAAIEGADPHRVDMSGLTAESPPDDASRGRRWMWVAWILIRLAGITLLAGTLFYPPVDQDVIKYTFWAHQLYAGHLPWRGYNVEYPPGVLPLMVIPGGVVVYELQFIALAMIADAYVAAMLWRSRPRGIGSWLWLVLPIALGPLVWVHLDIFVAAALVGFVVAVRAGRWRTAGACLAAATLLKLWPIVALVVLWRLIPAAGRRRVAAWTIGGVAAVTLPVVAYGGGHGLAWMLHYQGGRGLEIETVWAWPVVVAHWLGATVHPVLGHGGVEVQISGLVSAAATLALPLAVLALTAYVWRDRGRRLTLASATLLTVAVALVGSKALSPQYVIWALALVALVIDERSERSLRSSAWLVGATITLAATTQLVFPFYFVDVYFTSVAGVVASTAHAIAVLVWFGVVIRYVINASAAAAEALAGQEHASSEQPSTAAVVLVS
jgi:hypothetical protein